MTKIVYRFDIDGYFAGEQVLDESDLSPLEEGVYLIPAGCLEEAPDIPAGYVARVINGKWDYQLVMPSTSPEAPVATPVDQQAVLTSHVQEYMDAIARSYGYDSIASAVTYADEPIVPKFQLEGKAFRSWRSVVWAKCYELLDEVKNGKREIPTPDELSGLVPGFVPPGSIPAEESPTGEPESPVSVEEPLPD